jgi:ABC-type Mn2+/Zn2+ transport system permease subunit
VASFEAIGTLLVFGLLVGPPATATLLVRRVPSMLIVSSLLGSAAVIAGLEISYHHGTAGGATVALACIVEFFVVFTIRELSRAVSRRRAPAPTG